MSLPTLTLIPWAGLCNRMRAIASAQILAESHGRQLRIQWIPHPHGCAAAFEDLFLPAWEMTHPHASDPSCLLDIRRPIQDNPGWEQELAGPVPDLKICHFDEIKSSHYPLPSGVYEKKFLENLRRIQPRPAIANRVPVLPENCIGLHIRRGNHWHSLRYSPLSLFVKEMEETIDLHSTATFYLSTDCTRTEKTLRCRFGKRVHCQPGINRSRSEVRGIQDAVVDLLALSRCTLILGSYFSSFTSVASQWGGNPYRFLSLENSPKDWEFVEVGSFAFKKERWKSLWAEFRYRWIR